MHRADPGYPCLTTINWDEKVSFQNPFNTFTFESFQQRQGGNVKGSNSGCLLVLSSGKPSLIDCGRVRAEHN